MINKFFDRTLSKNAEEISDAVTDNFRVITHEKYILIGSPEYIVIILPVRQCQGGR